MEALSVHARHVARALLAAVIVTSCTQRSPAPTPRTHDPATLSGPAVLRWRADGTPDFGEPVPNGIAAPATAVVER